MRNGKRWITWMLLLCITAMVFVGCDEAASEEHPSFESIARTYNTTDTWGIYWYLCGSDLETESGAASTDFFEMMEVDLPENVFVVIQTGGAEYWDNQFVDPDYSERYLYDHEGLHFLESGDPVNMGSHRTFSDFLRYCVEEFPADHQALILWDHGGGSNYGVIFDELYDFDSLSLLEMETAFANVFGASPAEPPFELIGFDACLMATLDMAAVVKNYARFMVASQETEPSLGWDYEGFLTALAENPSFDGARLGRAICDSYARACEEEFMGGEVTLSVVDLSKIDTLLSAVSMFGAEALETAVQNQSFFVEYSRSAKSSENYGGNTPALGYYNMVDLGDLVRNTADMLPENASNVLSALADSVLYRVYGPYRAKSGGLSVYHSYDSDIDEFEIYADVGAVPAFVHFYDWAINGDMSDSVKSFINDLAFDKPDLNEISSLQTFDNSSLDLEDFPVYVTDDGYAVLDLGYEIADMLSAVFFQLAYIDEEEDIILFLGRDNDLDADWDEGVFYDNFRGVWGAIDGYLVYMDLVHDGDEYNLYSVPILLNDEEYSLSVGYDFIDETWEILGARKDNGVTGMANKSLVILQPGDVITTLHYVTSITGDDEAVQVPIDTFVYTENTQFAEEDMGDGTFIMMFEMIDIQNNSFLSELVMFTVEDGDIYTELY